MPTSLEKDAHSKDRLASKAGPAHPSLPVQSSFPQPIAQLDEGELPAAGPCRPSQLLLGHSSWSPSKFLSHRVLGHLASFSVWKIK